MGSHCPVMLIPRQILIKLIYKFYGTFIPLKIVIKVINRLYYISDISQQFENKIFVNDDISYAHERARQCSCAFIK